MLRYSRIARGIARKAAILVFGLAFVSGLADWYCLQTVERLNSVNNTLARYVSPARVALAEGKNAVTGLGLATYKSFAAVDPQIVRQANMEIRDSYMLAANALNNVSNYFPNRADDVRRIVSKLDTVLAVSKDVAAAVQAGERQRARSILDLRFDPALDDAAGQMNRLINILGGETGSILEQAAADEEYTRNFVVLSLVFGTALTAGLAIMLINRSVVRPLRRLADHAEMIGKTGTLLPYEDRAKTRGDEIGALSRCFDVMIRDLKDKHAEVAKHYERLDSAVNNMPQGICMFDADMNLIISNRRYGEIYALEGGIAAPGTSYRVLEQHLVERVYDGKAPAYLQSLSTAIQSRQALFVNSDLHDGRTIGISHHPMPHGGFLIVHEDVSERRRAEARIAHMALHDPLTDLPNRVQFRRELKEALTRAERGDTVAILMLDLDRFKAVNDTHGHPVGDAVLQQVADRLRENIRPTDKVARLSGDEFAILQVSAAQPQGSAALATRLIEKLSVPFSVDGREALIGVSIGVAIAPQDGVDPDTVTKHADIALYRAKEDGRGIHRYFEPDMDAKIRARRTLEADLRKAVANDEFEVFYQPVMQLESDTIVGFEALLRWHHPGRGLVSPTEFIPLAEDIGLIGTIGAWVLKEACAEAARWPSNIKVAVNISPRQFAERAVIMDVVAALASSGLSPARLELEITETVLLHETESTLCALNELRNLGVRISMDDFGTGYSSLGYLRKFPFDKIKIDKSFVCDFKGQKDAIAIIRAIAGLGSALGIVTTAEGVETEEQLEQLRAEGCTEIQGYLLSRPQPAAELPRLLSRTALSKKVA